jgi:hypothetical protein
MFNATPTNMTALLVVCLAAVSVFMLMRKRYDSNLPLMFYFFALVFANFFDRPVDPYVMYGGLAFALLLRFEFMGSGFTKFIAFCAGVGLCLTSWAMLAEAMV